MQILTSTLFEEKKKRSTTLRSVCIFRFEYEKKKDTHTKHAQANAHTELGGGYKHTIRRTFFFFFVRWIVAVVIRFTLLSQRLLSVIRRSSAIADTLLADVIPSTSFPGMLFFLNGSKRTNGFDLT